MGFPHPPGQNVPAWLVDAGKLEELLTRLTHALERPPSFSASLNPSLLAYDRASIGDSISAVSESARQTHVELRQALTAFSTASDVLGVIRREDDENSHSDVLRWLLELRDVNPHSPRARTRKLAEVRCP